MRTNLTPGTGPVKNCQRTESQRDGDEATLSNKVCPMPSTYIVQTKHMANLDCARVFRIRIPAHDGFPGLLCSQEYVHTDIASECTRERATIFRSMGLLRKRTGPFFRQRAMSASWCFTMPLSAGRRKQRILRLLVPTFRSGPEGVLQYSLRAPSYRRLPTVIRQSSHDRMRTRLNC